MSVLHEIFKYNNILYNDLDEVGKQKIDTLVENLKRREMDELLLQYSDRHLNIRDFIAGSTIDYITTLPDDLAEKIMIVYLEPDVDFEMLGK